MQKQFPYLQTTHICRILYIDMKIKQTILIFTFLLGLIGVFVGNTVYAIDTCGTTTAILDCPSQGIWGILLLAINILTAGIGIAAVGGIIYGAVLYTSAGGSADQIKKAKSIITNVIIGLISYALMYSVLNFFIPGGFLNNVPDELKTITNTNTSQSTDSAMPADYTKCIDYDEKGNPIPCPL